MIRILYVDDDADDILLLDRLLSKSPNYPVGFVAAHSFQHAVEILQRNQFDVILVDYKLSDDPSEPNGLDLCRKLCEAGLHVPVALVSGLSDIDHLGAQDVFDRGMVFINKKDLFQDSAVHWLQEYAARMSRVLIVDDCADDRRILRESLGAHQFLKFDIDEAGALADAVAKVNHQVPDVIVCDYMMGVQSAVPHLISLLHKHPSLSAVLVTDKPGVAEDRLAMKFIGNEKTVFISKRHIDDVSLARAVTGSRFKMLSLRDNF